MPSRHTEEQLVKGIGTKVPFDHIHEPGCYVCDWSGHLLRITEDTLEQGSAPFVIMIGRKTLYVTRISENPFLDVDTARSVAADWDVPVNF